MRTKKKTTKRKTVRRAKKDSKLKIDFVSSNVLNNKNERTRINYILGIVKDGTILVTDGVMDPDEELNLVRETMRRVDSGFPGIEVCSLKRESTGYQKVVERVFESKYGINSIVSKIKGKNDSKMNLKYGMTLIGPSKFIKDIKKNPDSFSVFAEMQR